jgi:type II secretory pathway pseudopilin PulG
MELMVVILIISIMSALVITSVSGGGGSENLNAGVTRWTGVFTSAQSSAITRKTRVRVAICYDPGETDKFLRYANIFYFDPQDTTTPWKPMSSGEFLPAGVYFSPGLSLAGGVPLNEWEFDFNFSTLLPPSNPTETVSPLTYSLSTSGDRIQDPLTGNGTDMWIVYEFSPNGTAVTHAQRMVIAQGLLNGTELVIPNWRVSDGFVIFRAGRPFHFQAPEQIAGN